MRKPDYFIKGDCCHTPISQHWFGFSSQHICGAGLFEVFVFCLGFLGVGFLLLFGWVFCFVLVFLLWILGGMLLFLEVWDFVSVLVWGFFGGWGGWICFHFFDLCLVFCWICFGLFVLNVKCYVEKWRLSEWHTSSKTYIVKAIPGNISLRNESSIGLWQVNCMTVGYSSILQEEKSCYRAHKFISFPIASKYFVWR